MGGLNPARPAGPGLPLVILYSDDLDATLRSVRSAGGTIDEEPFAFPGGRRFHFTDPAGNSLAVWQSA
jgi:predicted enzyme related to lactoylglutathione lyase